MDAEKFEIPEITEEKLLEMYETIKPIVYDSTKATFRFIQLDIEKQQLRNRVFTWAPDFLPNPTVNRPKLKTFKSVKFLSSGYAALWKPTVAEVFAFAQSDDEILKDAVAFRVEYLAMHESGTGSIGLATFYKRERPIAIKKEIHKNREHEVINEKIKRIKELEGLHQTCPFCQSRLDNITTIPPKWLLDKLDKYNKFIIVNLKDVSKEDLKKLKQLKFNFINKILDSNIKRIKKEKKVKNEKDKNNN